MNECVHRRGTRDAGWERSWRGPFVTVRIVKKEKQSSREDGMSRKINYYFTLVSPWAYIGDALFRASSAKHGVAVDYRPSISAGCSRIPADCRSANATRCASNTGSSNCSAGAKRGLSFAIKPNNWPFDPSLGDRCALALVQAGFDPAGFISAAFRCVFERERGLADRAVIADVLKACGADAEKFWRLRIGFREAAYDGNYDRALADGTVQLRPTCSTERCSGDRIGWNSSTTRWRATGRRSRPAGRNHSAALRGDAPLRQQRTQGRGPQRLGEDTDVARGRGVAWFLAVGGHQHGRECPRRIRRAAFAILESPLSPSGC